MIKYMTFNSSCSYAALANLLEVYNVDTTDRRIALDMGLPYLFAKEDGAYLAGPMLQGKRWFDLYLGPIGLTFTETAVEKTALPAYLRTVKTVMLGLYVSENNKHAVIYTGIENNLYLFLNNKWRESDEPDTLRLTEEELLSRVDDPVVVGALSAAEPNRPDMAPLYAASAAALRSMKAEIAAFCAVEHGPMELRQAMNPLFRPLLVDAITMTDLIGETALHADLKTLQGQFMAAVRAGKPVRLAETLDLPLLDRAADAYLALIHSKENP